MAGRKVLDPKWRWYRVQTRREKSVDDDDDVGRERKVKSRKALGKGKKEGGKEGSTEMEGARPEQYCYVSKMVAVVITLRHYFPHGRQASTQTN